MKFATPLAAVLLLAAQPGLAHAADGAKIFQLQCKTCHQAKSTPAGPSLGGVAGRKIAGLGDYAYSPALKAKAGTWTDADLDAFLTAPAKFAPGNKMPAALPGAADRAAVIAYMKTLK
ncbi:MAG TPA: c-type cytochrome [Phenylobacterium sp.]|nr:c-type cytochrome [Phenylobacterium sp.]